MNINTVTAFLVAAMTLSFLQHVLTCEHEAGNNTVNCTSRGLTEVPSNTFTDVITVLALTSNNLEILGHNAFGEYPDLTSLSLKKNNIDIVQMDAFHGLDKLMHLDLSRNKISFIYSTAFVSNINLETVDLSVNPLQNLNPTTLMISSGSIRKLLLSKSNLRNVTKHTFSGLPNVEFIDLSSNSLNLIPTDIFKPLRKLNRVYLGGNPWSCDVMEDLLLSKQDIIIDYKKIQCLTSDGEQRTLSWKPTQTTRGPSAFIETSSQRPIVRSHSEDGVLFSSLSTQQISTSSTAIEVPDSTGDKEIPVPPENRDTTRMDAEGFLVVLVIILSLLLVIMLITVLCYRSRNKIKTFCIKSQPADQQQPDLEARLITNQTNS